MGEAAGLVAGAACGGVEGGVGVGAVGAGAGGVGAGAGAGGALLEHAANAATATV